MDPQQLILRIIWQLHPRLNVTHRRIFTLTGCCGIDLPAWPRICRSGSWSLAGERVSGSIFARWSALPAAHDQRLWPDRETTVQRDDYEFPLIGGSG